MPLHRVFKFLSICFLAAFVLGCGSDDRTYPNFTSFQNNDAPVRLQFQNVPQRAAGTNFGTISVAIIDFNGIVVPTDTRAVTISLVNPGGATLSGTTTVNAVDGVATFSDLSVDIVGSYAFQASAEGLIGAESAPFTITSGAPGAMGVTFLQGPPTPPDPTNAIIKGVPISPPLQVEVRDQFGNLVTNDVTVTMVVGSNPTGTATLGGTTQVPTVNGVATFDNLTVETGGGVIVLAAAVGQGVAIADPTFVAAALDLYGVTAGPNPGVVRGQVFPAPAAPAPIGALVGYDSARGLVAHPNGNLVAIARNTGTTNFELLQLSATNAAIISNTVITGSDGTNFTGLTVNPANGTLYTYIPNGTNVGLHTIALNTAAVTFTGPSGLAGTGEGLGWEPFVADSFIYTGGGAGADGLSILAPDTGAATQIAAQPVLNLTDLDVNPFNTDLTAVDFPTGIYTINKMTGVSTGPTPGTAGIAAIAFRVPEAP
jgi:hypothetical protein